MRIAKFIAAAGICSRRDAEKLIAMGKVQLNGEVLNTPAYQVVSTDKVTINGHLVSAVETPRVWLLNKPPHVITTHKDPQQRQTVFDILPDNMPRVISVGRLDYLSQGLLLLTNSGSVARYLEHPSSQIERVYKVCVRGDVQPYHLQNINQGIQIDGVLYQHVHVSIISNNPSKTWIEFRLLEGKNREIRNIVSFMGWQMIKLIRTHYGPFALGDLAMGEVAEVTDPKLKNMLPCCE